MVDENTVIDFKSEATKRLIKLFEKVKLHETVNKEKHRLEGFLHAGEYLNLITHAEGAMLLEEAHFHVFGESIQSRKTRREKLRHAVETDDDAYFETPAVSRVKVTK